MSRALGGRVNGRDLSLLDELIEDDVNHPALPGTPPGPGGQGAVLERVRAARPDARFEIAVGCDDDAVSPLDRTRRDDVLAAGLAGAIFAAIPSTAWSLIRGDDVLDGGRAAGAMLLPNERRTPVLLLAAVPVHLALSVGWAGVLAAALPQGAEPLWGGLAGLGIAAFDLAVIGRHIPAIRALPQGRQWADHLAFGATVGAVLHIRRRREPAARPGPDPSHS